MTSLRGTWTWLKRQLRGAVGMGTPGEMLVGVVMIGILVFLIATLAIPGLIVLVPVLILLFILGLARFVPFVGRRWPVR